MKSSDAFCVATIGGSCMAKLIASFLDWLCADQIALPNPDAAFDLHFRQNKISTPICNHHRRGIGIS